MLAYERKGYEELLADGGRPWYPIHFLETVSTNPVEHKELLHCWQGDTYYGQNAWEVFEPQLLRWRDFRAWQLKMRERHAESLPKYVDDHRKHLAEQSFTQPVNSTRTRQSKTS